jgi:hypothetical protein
MLQGADAVAERRRALIVAVDQYDQLSLQRLSSPAADAEALAGVLGDQDLGGFEVDIVHNLTSWVAAERVEAMLVIARAGGEVDVGDQFRQRELGESRGRVVITASTAMEYAFEVALAPELLDLVAHPLAAVRLTAVRELAPIATGTNAGRAAAARRGRSKCSTG